MKIKEVIVVEGKNDTNKLKQFLECDTIETSGTDLSKEKLDLLQEVQKTRGIIIFTDPDAPGTLIRARINEKVKGAKNAFIMKQKARTSKKVGIEHASKEDLLESLSHLLTYDENVKETLSKADFMELGLSGKSDSALLREKLGERLFLGKCNAKTLWKRLNMLQLNKKQIIEMIEDIYE